MAKGKSKSIKLITKIASNRGKNDKHPPIFTHNHKYSKKEIESIYYSQHFMIACYFIIYYQMKNK